MGYVLHLVDFLEAGRRTRRGGVLREASRPRYEVPRVYGTRRPGRIRFGVTGLCENFFSF